MQIVRVVLLLIALMFSLQAQSEIYRYQDANGNWHFSDKKPESKNNVDVIDTSRSKPGTKALKPYTDIVDSNIYIYNPLPAPIHAHLKMENGKIYTDILEPNSSSLIFQQSNTGPVLKSSRFWYLIGRPQTKPDNYRYLPPFKSYKPMQISQSFNGRFSHFREPNKYAIDLAMPVGTKITAVREGIVVSTKSDYPIAGVNSPFFLDKANYVRVYHEDGTQALYAHLLLGRVVVKTGDKVEAGQVLGYSGNTGYSTGPHLHFVIQYNHNGRLKSLPFKFVQPEQNLVTPVAREWLLPLKK